MCCCEREPMGEHRVQCGADAQKGRLLKHWCECRWPVSQMAREQSCAARQQSAAAPNLCFAYTGACLAQHE